MRQMGITGKIWLSIGVFVLGSLIAIGVGQIQGLFSEARLKTTSDALFPAAQRSQQADAGFQRMGKLFGDAVLLEDVSALDQAEQEGRAAVDDLRTAAALAGLANDRAEALRLLASDLAALVSDSRAAYAPMAASGGNLTDAMQQRSRVIAQRSNGIKVRLTSAREMLARDLQGELMQAVSGSIRQRRVSLVVFFLALAAAAVVVTITIRRSVIKPVADVVDNVLAAASLAANASTRMAEISARGASDQEACLHNTTKSLEEISGVTQQNVERTSRADGLMREAREAVDQGTGVVDQLTASMTDIAQATRQAAKALKSIDEIAFLTNLLALNAAVEAARAGAAGAGFAVVADEVRALAHRAAQAANESGMLIAATSDRVQAGVDRVALTRDAFSDIAQVVTSSNDVFSEISRGTEQQTESVGRISRAIAQMEAITRRNAEHARETADAAAQVSSTREYVDRLVAVVGLTRETSHDAAQASDESSFPAERRAA